MLKQRRLSSVFASAATPALITLLGCSASGPGAEPWNEPIARTTSPIHANPNSSPGTVGTEVDNTSGAYPATMVLTSNTNACTGTVVAPYAILTAGHCHVDTTTTSNWRALWGDGSSGFVLSLTGFQNVWTNPLYQDTAYQPTWWSKIYQSTPQPQWGPYDQQIAFVPTLTPYVLATKGIAPMAVGAPPQGGSGFQYTAVGTASVVTNESRPWVPVQFVAVPTANQNQALNLPVDGMLQLDTTTANFGSTDNGDSGGPVVGFQRVSAAPGMTVDINRFIVSTNSTTAGQEVLLSQSVPISLTPNQQLAAKQNALWVNAQIDDADGDGLPTACDSDPSTANPTPLGTSLCGPEVGAPYGVSLASLQSTGSSAIPIAQLACKPGYVAVGLSGRAGALIDDLAVQCQPLDCLAGKACAPSYTTDDFIGTGGVPFSETCPSGDVLVGIQGQMNPGPNGQITSLQGLCTPWGSLGTSTTVTLGTGVGGTGATAYASICPGARALIGFQARSVNDAGSLTVVTGLQPICDDVRGQVGLSIGGTGGGYNDLPCPSGTLANGLAWSIESGSGQMGMLGTTCFPAGLIEGNALPVPGLMWVAHGSNYDPSTNVNVPAMVEPFVGAHVASNTQYTYCPGGYAFSGFEGTASSAGTGQVAGISLMLCRQLGNSSNLIGVAVNAGQYNSGTTILAACPGTSVSDGMFIHSGWITDSAAPHCTSGESWGIFNGGFETGTLAGWTPSGASETVTTTTPYAGTDDAMLGLPTATNGDSTIVQNFVAVPGTTMLSIHYKMSCPDSLTYDWFTISLTDNSSGTSSTILPKTCVTSSWTGLVTAVRAGHNYTLTLTSHDDNYAADPSYTLVDGITLQ